MNIYTNTVTGIHMNKVDIIMCTVRKKRRRS